MTEEPFMQEPSIQENILEKLGDRERKRIVSLPYRVGLWISLSDQTGGDKADAKELLALNNILIGFSQDVFGSELMQHVMEETVARRSEWEKWTADIDNVPQEAAGAVEILRQHVIEKDVGAYVTRLMEIAEAVAVAFREFDEVSSLEQFKMRALYARSYVMAKLGGRPPRSFAQFVRISLSEREALNTLARSLNAPYLI